MREIIKVKNVSKVYKINKRKSGLFGAVLNLFAPRYEKKIAVSDMNFSIEEGEAVAFIGSNGAGKSTTIKMLSGILYPSEGEITVASYVPYKQRKICFKYWGCIRTKIAASMGFTCERWL